MKFRPLHELFEIPLRNGLEELIQMAKDFKAEMEKDANLGLNPDEVAFYDAP